MGWKKLGKKITRPHLYFYEKKLTGIWGENKVYIYSIKSEKRL